MLVSLYYRETGGDRSQFVVRATRNPRPAARSLVMPPTRNPERKAEPRFTHEPPRLTRREQSPDSQALPFVGAPE